MKRSRRIGLTLMASLSLAACDSEQPAQQAFYQSQQACVDDWGSDECDDDDGDGHWRGPLYFYHGGGYHYYKKKGGTILPVAATSKLAGLSAGASPPGAMATKTASVPRGGFGRAAASHGASS